MKIKNAILFVIAALSMVLMATAQTPKQTEENPLKNYADSQLVEFLNSKDLKESSTAAKELFSRGDRVIPELLKLEGNNNCFYGLQALGKKGEPGSNYSDYVCEGNSKVSMEIAALYLISAIFEEDIEYARPPFLHNENATDGNNSKNIKTAWKATKRWYETVKRDGIDYSRDRSQWPLRSVGMLF
jgi:hypothetical protein